MSRKTNSVDWRAHYSESRLRSCVGVSLLYYRSQEKRQFWKKFQKGKTKMKRFQLGASRTVTSEDKLLNLACMLVSLRECLQPFASCRRMVGGARSWIKLANAFNHFFFFFRGGKHHRVPTPAVAKNEIRESQSSVSLVRNRLSFRVRFIVAQALPYFLPVVCSKVLQGIRLVLWHTELLLHIVHQHYRGSGDTCAAAADALRAPFTGRKQHVTQRRLKTAAYIKNSRALDELKLA